MWQTVIRGVVAGLIVVGVAEFSKRSPRLGALLLTLPLVSILAFLAAWYGKRELDPISRLARETLVLVPLGLPFFVPLAFAQRLGLGFWQAVMAGIALASAVIGIYFWLAPKSL
jgi:hypothetical protein